MEKYPQDFVRHKIKVYRIGRLKGIAMGNIYINYFC